MTNTFYGCNQGHALFDFIDNPQEYDYLKSAHQSISECELWGWFSLYEPENGFMFSNTPEIIRLQTALCNYECNSTHSGSSFGSTLRQMEYIAKHGYTQYKQTYISNKNAALRN